MNISEQLLERLVEIGGFSTRTEAVRAAVEEFIRRREREALVESAGEVEFVEGHLHTLHRLEEDA